MPACYPLRRQYNTIKILIAMLITQAEHVVKKKYCHPINSIRAIKHASSKVLTITSTHRMATSIRSNQMAFISARTKFINSPPETNLVSQVYFCEFLSNYLTTGFRITSKHMNWINFEMST